MRPTASLRCAKGGHRSRRNPTRFDLVDAKVQAVFDHIVSAYGDDGTSVYRVDEPAVGGAIGAGVAVLAPPDLDTITEGVIERIRSDAQFAAPLS